MRLNEFSSPLNMYLVTVKVHGTVVKTLIHAESQSHARLLLSKMFGKDNIQSINSISTNESQTTISLNLQEAVSADDLVSLWQIVSQNVFQAIEKERREAEEEQRLEASKPKRSRAVRSPSRSVSAVKTVTPKTLRPKAVKPKLTKPQVAKTPTIPKTVSMQKSPQMTKVAKPQTQSQSQSQFLPRTQQPIMPRTNTVQPTRRSAQVAQPITQQQSTAQLNRNI